jgi:hypothetical protein
MTPAFVQAAAADVEPATGTSMAAANTPARHDRDNRVESTAPCLSEC